MRSLGELLVESRALTAAQRDSVVLRQRTLAIQRRIKLMGQICIDIGLITTGQLQAALDRQRAERSQTASDVLDTWPEEMQAARERVNTV